MKKFVAISMFLLSAVSLAAAQAKPSEEPSKIPASVPVNPGTKPIPVDGAKEPKIDPGNVSGKTYTNTMVGFEVVITNTWLIPGDDFEGFMKDKGYDLRVKVKATDPQMKANIKRFEKQVTLLLTA